MRPRRAWDVFDRPVFVLAAPRSGSTLLREMLDKHPDLAAWPGEAHSAFAAARPHVVLEGHRWEPEVATPELRRDLSRELYRGWVRSKDEASARDRLGLRTVRLLEKTPANILRVGALARLYPDAKLVFLHRDAPSSIGSLLESWETPSGAHARFFVDGVEKRWMMLAAPGWVELADAPVAQRAAFQWSAATQYALDDLADIAPERVVQLSYEQLVADPEANLRRVLEHCELRIDEAVLATSSVVGRAGRTSLSAPHADKWRQRADEIEPVLADLAPLRRRLGYEA